MKSPIAFTFRLIAPLAALACHASADPAAAPPDRPLLWKIEPDALLKPSYLFGTIHLTTPRIAILHPAAERAFAQADAVVTEISLDPKTQLEASVLMMRGDGSTLTESIGEMMIRSIRDFGENEQERDIGKRLLKRLLTDRDVTMAATIDGLLKEHPGKSHFFAVGAAHLIGDTSIRKHLEAKGYRITRIAD